MTQDVEDSSTFRTTPLYHAAWHIVNRACHWGFLSIAVRPQGLPNGFAAYFCSTLDLSGMSNQRLVSVLAHATTIPGLLHIKSSLNEWNYQKKEERPRWVAGSLVTMRDLCGQRNHDLLLKVLGALPRMREEPFVGSFRDQGPILYTGSSGKDKVQMADAVERLYKACHETGLFRPEDKELPRALLHNLAQHIKQLVPSRW